MKLSHDEIAHIQTQLDQQWVKAQRSYEQALASGIPAWWLKKPERIILMELPSVQRTFKRNTAGTRKVQAR